MADEKPISAQKMMIARGLFALAGANYQRANAAMEELAELLGYNEMGSYCGCISDEAVDNGNFDRGMKKEGFFIKPARKKR